MVRFQISLRPVVLPVLVFLAIAVTAVACGGGSSSTSTTNAAGGGARTIQVSMKDNVFVPKEMSASVGETVTFELKNDGLLLHDMHFLNDTT